ncbi:hypothetical protein ADU59_06860 [Pararhizobium polonicum]|uniref:Serine acetyltransferase n=1 Tax=Pararhizobium polonicum TaxID=1612624 RepID=A0A1C7P486_9HYPH|nr:hypothetical protein [Pararhizobium polonicum]OBZ96085.1 hypothetical protein ADU59_06860 [Pararhizobium polonicum]
MPAISKIINLGQFFEHKRLRLLSRAAEGVIRVLFQASIPARAQIAKSVFFHHSGLGVVINRLSVIEDDCEIGVHVVLGGKAPTIGAPHLEKGVIVHAGARIIGPIRIGAGSVVAANAVVTKDVPPNSLVAGVPAVVKRSDIDNKMYRHDAPQIALSKAAEL